MTVTHKQAFTIHELLHKSEQLCHIILKMKVKSFRESQCSGLVTLAVVGNLRGLFLMLQW
jgi:hypothetical protein